MRSSFRAFNEGVAYRFETTLPVNTAKVYSEEVRLNFAGDYNVYYPRKTAFSLATRGSFESAAEADHIDKFGESSSSCR